MPLRPKLTNSSVEKFKCRLGRKQDRLWCGELRGFGVQVSADGATRTYFFDGRVKGRKDKRFIKIGRHNDPWRVDDARAIALELKTLMAKGIDPVEEEERKKKEAEKESTIEAALSETFRELMEDYVKNKRTKHGPLRPKTKADIRRHCNENLADWQDRPWARTTREMCLEKFRELSSRAPTQANGCVRYVRAMLNWDREKCATADGQYPVLPVNPVSRMFKLAKPNPSKPKDTRIPLKKVGACWLWLQEQSAHARTENQRCSASWVSSMLVSGLRREESAAVKKADVDLENRTITLHGDIAVVAEGSLFAGVKNHNTFVLPMSTPLYEIMAARLSPAPVPEKIARRRRVRRSTEFVFATNGRKKPYIDNAEKTFKALSAIAGTRVHAHAIRRTFEDIAQECEMDPDVRRMLLNHTGGDVHSIHYANNLKRLPAAFEKVAQWILAQAAIARAQATGANVVPLRA